MVTCLIGCIVLTSPKLEFRSGHDFHSFYCCFRLDLWRESSLAVMQHRFQKLRILHGTVLHELYVNAVAFVLLNCSCRDVYLMYSLCLSKNSTSICKAWNMSNGCSLAASVPGDPAHAVVHRANLKPCLHPTSHEKKSRHLHWLNLAAKPWTGQNNPA